MVEQIIKSLFSKDDSFNNTAISELIKRLSIPSSFSIAINRLITSDYWSNNTIVSKNNNFILQNRIKLQKFIIRYHLEAETMTANVLNNINLLNEPNTQLLVSIHQPNLFPYGGIFKKIILLEALKNTIEKSNEEKKFINLFIIVDHDFMDEYWVRNAELPSVYHSLGILTLRMPVDKSKRWLMIKNMPLPTRTILEDWKQQISSWLIKNSSMYLSSKVDKMSVLNNFEDFWKEVEYSYSNAKSYSDLNSFLMSSIINKMWNYGTLFVRFSDLSPVFEDGIKYLILNYEKYSEILRKSESMFKFNGIDMGISPSVYENAPLWLHCKCGSKASTKIYKNQNEKIFLEGKCKSCKKDLHLDIGTKNDIALSSDILQNLSLRAIPSLLLYSRDLGINCYASGVAGIKYIIFGSRLFEELSINMPLIMIWPSRDVYYGIGQKEALKTLRLAKYSDINTYLELLKQKNLEYEKKIQPLLDEQQGRLKVNESIPQQLRQDFSNLKEEQRKIRQQIKVTEKVKNTTDLRPCFIDYAVNFGIKNIGIQWYDSLIKENNLVTPLLLNIPRDLY